MTLTHTLILTATLAMYLAVSGQSAPRIYLNPSDQIHNWSPDRTYCEAECCQDVARRLEAKLNARGFEVKNSDGATMADSCNAANEWPADVFVSLHTNARGGSGWGTPHGTLTLYYQPRQGEPNQISIELAQRCMDKVVEKYTTHGVGHPFGVRADLPFLNFNLYVLRRTQMPGTLVEGLFHDNEADTAVLKTDEGRDAYAQGVYEAVCDYFGWNYYPDAPILHPVGPIANDADGLLAFVVRGPEGNALAIRQAGINGAWSTEWLDIKGSIVGEPAMALNSQGRLQVFARGVGDRVFHKVQASAGVNRWNGWYDLGGTASTDLSVAKTGDGRLVVLALGHDGNLRYRAQKSLTSGIQWDEWKDLGGLYVGKPAVSGDRIVARTVNDSLAWAVLGATEWQDIGGNVSGDPHIVDREDDPAIFCLGEDGRVLFVSLDGEWEDLGGSFVGNPAASVSTDGRLEVFAIDKSGEMCHNSQTPEGKWTGWQSLGGAFAGQPWIGRNLDGRIVVFAADKNGRTQYRVQREPAKSAIWDGWYPLGATQSK